MRRPSTTILAVAAVGFLGGLMAFALTRGHGTVQVVTESDLPPLVSETSGADLVVEVPTSSVLAVGEIADGDGERSLLYEVDLSDVELGVITNQTPQRLSKVVFQRSVEFADLGKVLPKFERVVLLIDFIPDGPVFGHAIGVDSDGTLVAVDWSDQGGFEAIDSLASSSSVVAALTELGRARVELLRPDWLPGPVSQAGRDLYDHMMAPYLADAGLDAGAAWRELPPHARNIDESGGTPGDVLASRTRVNVLINIDGSDSDTQAGSLVYLTDADGVLYAFDIGVGPHAAVLFVDPGKPVSALLSDDTRYPEADSLGILDLSAQDLGTVFGVEVVLAVSTNPSVAPVAMIGRTFHGEEEFANAHDAVVTQRLESARP